MCIVRCNREPADFPLSHEDGTFCQCFHLTPSAPASGSIRVWPMAGGGGAGGGGGTHFRETAKRWKVKHLLYMTVM